MIQDIQLETTINGRDAMVRGRYCYIRATRVNPPERWFSVTGIEYAEAPYEVEEEDIPTEETLADLAAQEVGR